MAEVVTVGQLMIPLMEDYKDDFAGYILKDTLHNNNLNDTTNTILDAQFSSLENNIQGYYNYAFEGSYVDGLPELGFVVPALLDEDVVAGVLESIEGEPVSIISMDISPLNLTNSILERLLRQYQYDPITGILGLHPFSTLNDVTYHSSEYENPEEGDTSIVATCYVLVDGEVKALFSIDWIPFANQETYSNTALTLTVIYSLVSDITNKELSWSYNNNSGIPSIDAGMSGIDLQDRFPVVTIREGGVDVIDSVEPDRVTSTDKMLNFLGTDLKTITDGILSNEGSDKVADAHVFLSLHVDSDTPEVQSYLFDYFDLLRRIDPDAKTRYDSFISGASGSFLGITQTVDERSLTYMATINYIERTDGVTLNIGDIGSTSSLITLNPKIKNKEASYITYTKQVTATTCDVIKVHGITNECTIGRQRSRRSVTLLEELGDQDDSKSMVVPLSKVVLNTLNIKDANVVIAASIQLNIYAIVITKIKWYQSKLFKIVLTIVAIVVMILYPNQGIIDLLAKIGITSAMVVFVVQMIYSAIIGVVLAKGAQIIADIVGGDIAIIIAAVLVIYSLTQGDFNLGKDTLMTSSDLLTASNALMKGLKDNLAEDMKEIMYDYERKYEQLELAYKGLEEYDSLFDEGIDLYSDNINQEFINNPDEHPDAFIDRTTDLNYTIVGTQYQLDNYNESSMVLPGIDF